MSLLESQVQVEIAEQQIKLQQSGHYPTVSLEARYSTSDNERTITGDNGQEQTTNLPRLDSRSIGLNVSVPIFSGFRTSSEIAQARDNYVVSSQQMVQTRRNVERQVRNSFMKSLRQLPVLKHFNSQLFLPKVL